MTAGSTTIKDRIAGRYGELSERLRQAADYVVVNEIEIATHSLRTVSGNAGLAPATFTRLCHALGFANYEEMRDLCRASIGRQALSFADRARLLVEEEKSSEGRPFFDRQLTASLDNLSLMGSEIDRTRLTDVVEAMASARQVVLFGALSSFGIAAYFAYLANYFTDNWKVAGKGGELLSASLAGLNERDVLFVVSMAPFARRAVVAAQMASNSGAFVVVVTDNHTCPILNFASAHFIVPTESPQFFSSYVATLVLIETMIGMLVMQMGTGAQTRIEGIETQNHHNGEFWGE